jgi:Tfp pilus assembly protein PilE
MKNIVLLVIVVVIAAVGLYAWKQYQAKAPLDDARSRVQSMLDAKARGDNQTALCEWAQGKASLSMDEISASTDRFDDFVGRAGLENLESYQITDAKAEGAETVLVTVKLGADTLRLRVRPRTPIEIAR